jgi:hypothetical protein
MNCSTCGSKTIVLATRSLAKPGKGAEVNKVAKVVDWYTCDFVARKRKCVECNKFIMTVELLLDDAENMIAEASSGHAPKS